MLGVTNERQYLAILREVYNNGLTKDDRTGVGTRSLFGPQMKFNLFCGFPAVTTKKLFFRGVKEELLWILRGETNAKSLQERGVHIWDEWADPDGDLGPIYGVQWRNWRGIDQIRQALERLKRDPDSRRHLVSAWNVSDLEYMALAPCHVMFQFYVAPNQHGGPPFLHCQLYQRSADMFLGVPFNIASYALLTSMMAHVLDYSPGILIHTIGDAHIYLNHFEAVEEQLSREPFDPPTLWLNSRVTDIDEFKSEDIELEGYESHPIIPAPVAV